VGCISVALKRIQANNEYEIRDYLDVYLRQEMENDILKGLGGYPKSIPSKYFYDAEGSRLFKEICKTPEYYQTRTEMSILRTHGASIMDFFAEEGGDLVELGSGSEQKVRTLLDSIDSTLWNQVRYVPLDICEDSLHRSAYLLTKDYDGLAVLGLLADFTRQLGAIPDRRKLIIFLGSSVGNFTHQESVEMLSSLRAVMQMQDRFLLGMDMVKPKAILENAYNDSVGLTRSFNLNLLNHINRELNGNIDPAHFEHLAFFNEHQHQIEMHLKVTRPIQAMIDDLGLSVEMETNQTIHTEISRKFTKQSAEKLFTEAGLSVNRWFQDSQKWFSLVELERAY
jgi:L-histidine N-alpha-methyltransferase